MMKDSVEKMFSNVQDMLGRLKKAAYKQRMEQFTLANAGFFQDMAAAMERADDRDGMAQQVSEEFIAAVEEKYAGKIRGRTQADLTMFMIYFVFPTILSIESPHSRQLADALCALWSERIAGRAVGYTTYEKLYDSFREKICGIF